MLDFQEELEKTSFSLRELKDTVKQERECLKELGKTIPMVASLQVRLMICLVDEEKYILEKCFPYHFYPKVKKVVRNVEGSYIPFALLSYHSNN